MTDDFMKDSLQKGLENLSQCTRSEKTAEALRRIVESCLASLDRVQEDIPGSVRTLMTAQTLLTMNNRILQEQLVEALKVVKDLSARYRSLHERVSLLEMAASGEANLEPDGARAYDMPDPSEN